MFLISYCYFYEKIMILKRYLTDKQGEKLNKKFLEDNCYDVLITQDTDAYDNAGNMLFRFRKGVIPIELLLSGVNAFKGSIERTEGRGAASGATKKRVLKDGTVSNITVGEYVESGNVGYMDAGAMVRYCRKTAFARNYFEQFKQGIPFVQCVDKLYSELCPTHYALQKRYAEATNRNYVIEGTSFTTVTVNKNFRTAVHKDSGDLQQGFGNLCVYREGAFEGGFFCLPEFRVAVDMQNQDMLFVDVHRWHGNTEFKNCSDDWLRISFVMYYRENMIACKSPTEELARVKKDQGGFFKI